MAFTRKTVRADVSEILGQFPVFSGENELGEESINLGIRQAVNILSLQFPDEVIEDEVGDDGRYYDLDTLLTSWETGFSRILSIDYDADTRVSSDERPNFLSENDGDWEFYNDASVEYIFFPSLSPSSSITWRVKYTRRHVLNDVDDTTIPDRYQEGIIYLAVSRVASMAMIRAEKALDPPGGAEFVTMRTKGSGFKSIANDYMEFYIREIGGSADGVGAASTSKNFDQLPAYGGDYMFHPRRSR